MNLLGIIIGIGCVITGMMIEGTSPMILVNFPAFIVVCGFFCMSGAVSVCRDRQCLEKNLMVSVSSQF